MKLRLPALLILASAAAFGADREFDRLVNAVEDHFDVHRTYIPLMGVANFFVKVARPAGTSGIKLAVFEDLRGPDETDGPALDRMMAEAAAGLYPMVRVRSRRDREWTYIYTGEVGKTTTMLIATFERREATIVQVKVNLDALLRTINEPRFAVRRYAHNDRGMKEP